LEVVAVQKLFVKIRRQRRRYFKYKCTAADS